MATYKITIDENSIAGKKFLSFIKTLPFVSMSKTRAKKKKPCGLDEALEDIRMGRVFEIEDWQAYSDQVAREVLMEQEAANEI